MSNDFHNPWRDSLENCISGDNYLRASEYNDLIEELDELYRLRAALSQPQAAQPEAVAWLIESRFTGSSVTWWNGLPEGAGVSYTSDPNAAVRFSRKEDAERVAQNMHMVKVTEHVWI